MTWRSLTLGTFLGLTVAGLTYLNDVVLGQGLLVFHLMPVSVLGVVVLLRLAWNPAAGRVGEAGRLTASELSVITAMGLASCALPDAGFLRTATTNLVMPGLRLSSKPAWQSTGVMSYVPGGSALVAPGHLYDPRGLARRLLDDEAAVRNAVPQWTEWPTAITHRLQDVAEDRVTGDPAKAMAAIINDRLRDPAAGGDDATLVQRRARWVAAFPEHILPMPPGGPFVMLDRPGQDTAGRLLMGDDKGFWQKWPEVPWDWWAGAIRLWVPLVLLLSVCSLCLALIVHPQWSQRELLAYPIARVMGEVIGTRGAAPVLGHRLFWIGMVATGVLHLINGAHGWNPKLPMVPTMLDFNPLRVLFPNAARVPDSFAYFQPWIIPTAVAFAFFLPTSVSLSVGISPLLFVALGAVMLGQGASLSSDYLGADNANLLRLGAYLAMAGLVVYYGRHHYAAVARASLGLGARDEVSASLVWAARVLLLAAGGAVAVLATGGLDWPLALAFVLLVLLTFVIIARITAETGLFYVQAWWLPAGVITALLGFEAVGPTAYLALAIASIMLVGDTRTVLMGYAVNALQLTRPAEGRSVAGRVTWAMAIVVVAGFFLAGAVTLTAQHTYGLNITDKWTRDILPAMPYDQAVNFISHQSGSDTVYQSLQRTGLARLAAWQPAEGALLWTAVGAALVIACSVARLRLPWWPLHPVLFLVWGTFGANRYAFSFLLGCIIKHTIVKTLGTRGYQQLIPLGVGLICGEILAGLLWLLVGTAYHLATGEHPVSYLVQ